MSTHIPPDILGKINKFLSSLILQIGLLFFEYNK